MSTHSTDGREWARLSKLKAGDKVTLDDGFTCGISNKTLEVFEGIHGLYLKCDVGRHFLDGQLSSKTDHLVGVWPAAPEADVDG